MFRATATFVKHTTIDLYDCGMFLQLSHDGLATVTSFSWLNVPAVP